MQLPQIGFPSINAFLSTPLGQAALVIGVLGLFALTFYIVNIAIRNAANPGARWTNVEEPEMEEDVDEINQKL